MTSRPENGVYGRCTCGRIWLVVTLPMPLTDAANAMLHAHCPRCGNGKGIKIASAEDFELAQSRADGGASIVTKHTNIAGQ